MITDIKILEKENVKQDNENKFLKEEVTFNKIHFFGVRFDNITKETAVKSIQNFLLNNKKSRKVFFTNVHTIYLAKKDPVFAQTINNADLVLPDGIGLKIAGEIFSKPVKENLNGTDFTPLVLQAASQSCKKVYLLGASQEVVQECVRKLKMNYPGLNIAGYHSGYFSKWEEGELVNEIKRISPDILLVAMGSPQQEILAGKFAEELNNTVCFAVGGLFDFISGIKKRAPLIFRKAGIEWLFRFTQDPKTKWERMVIEIPAFLLSVITAKFFTNSIYSSSFDRRPYII
jgi:N-acetylglucosaminyldiphosphoundecaprenol N-acetyl-beta-D-mannosaminyltransferase